MNNSITSLKNENILNIDTLKKDYNHKIKELQNIHNKETEELKITIEDYKQELKRLKGLNGNLLRISRERANQERNLRPKKAHSGFVVLNRISFDLIEDEIIDAFSDFIKDLKIDNWYNYNYIINQSISKIKDIVFNSQYDNFIFKYSYTANCKSNLWDIDIYTKKDISN